MGSINGSADGTTGSHDLGNGKKQIFLNAFDMSTVGHLSPGQWKVRDLGLSNIKRITYKRFFRTPWTNLRPRGPWNTGSSLRSCSSVEALMHSSSRIPMGGTIRMKAV